MDLVAYFVGFALIFGLLDAVWLKSTNALYRNLLGHIMRDKPNFVAAIIFYIIYVAGVVWFAFVPDRDIVHVIVSSGVLAFVAYATYDLTNLATVKQWPVKIVIIDIIWGTTATTAAAAATYALVGLIGVA